MEAAEATATETECGFGRERGRKQNTHANLLVQSRVKVADQDARGVKNGIAHELDIELWA
ncbi:hypothetical protein T492DRAFT_886735 [Pavlovales sp. CCMP2436]|nr:hypothetical protein T492DRAFT_886735 [Pavlovales sp. CCMP2436]